MIRKLLLVLGGLTLLAAAGTAPAYALPAPSGSAAGDLCAQAGTGYCLNDWNGGGPGAPMDMYSSGTDNDIMGLSPVYECYEGEVTDGQRLQGPACPFKVGTGLNTKYLGDTIYSIPLVNFSAGNGYCVGTDYHQNANVGSCPSQSGGSGSNIWVWGPACTAGGHSGNYLINVYWSNKYGSTYSLESGGSIGAQAYVTYGLGSCWAQPN